VTGLIVKEKIMKEGRALIIGNWLLLHYHHIISGRVLSPHHQRQGTNAIK
jgi:hypothetical protein